MLPFTCGYGRKACNTVAVSGKLGYGSGTPDALPAALPSVALSVACPAAVVGSIPYLAKTTGLGVFRPPSSPLAEPDPAAELVAVSQIPVLPTKLASTTKSRATSRCKPRLHCKMRAGRPA